jgi:hypothetical protein
MVFYKINFRSIKKLIEISILLIVASGLLLISFLSYDLEFLFLGLVLMFGNMIFNWPFTKIEISEENIKEKSLFRTKIFKWSEVKTIRIIKSARGTLEFIKEKEVQSTTFPYEIDIVIFKQNPELNFFDIFFPSKERIYFSFRQDAWNTLVKFKP